MQRITIISDDALFSNMMKLVLESVCRCGVDICAEKISACDFCLLDLDFSPDTTVGEHSLTFSRSPHRSPDLVRPFRTECLLDLFSERVLGQQNGIIAPNILVSPDRDEHSRLPIQTLDGHRVAIGGQIISLSAKEYSLFVLLLSRRGEVVEKDEIKDHLPGSLAGNTAEVYINMIRKKLSACGIDGLIKTVHKRGYMLS